MMKTEPCSDRDSSDSVEYDSDDHISGYERRILKLKRRRTRAFVEEFNNGESLKVSTILDTLPKNNEVPVADVKKVVQRKRKMSTQSIVSHPRKSLRLSGRGRIDFCGLDDDFQEPSIRRKRTDAGTRRNSLPTIRLRQVEFNPEALTGSVVYNSQKVYSSSGTTCHQCRQKTVDLKSQCYSPTCVGIRGQFCGYCLHGRYGEDVAVVLKDKNWRCPPCRGICNCSICRRQNGKPPTGQLKQIALRNGYSSVVEYLEDRGDAKLIKKEEEDEDDENVENQGAVKNETKDIFDVTHIKQEPIDEEDVIYDPIDLKGLENVPVI